MAQSSGQHTLISCHPLSTRGEPSRHPCFLQVLREMKPEPSQISGRKPIQMLCESTQPEQADSPVREAGEQGPRSAGPQASALLQACAIDSVRAAVSPGLGFSCTEAPLLSSCNVYDPLDTEESDTFRTDCRSTPPTFSGHTVPDPEAIPTSTRP